MSSNPNPFITDDLLQCVYVMRRTRGGERLPCYTSVMNTQVNDDRGTLGVKGALTQLDVKQANIRT